MSDFRQLEVWNKAHQVTLSIYRITKKFPNDERFGLVSQMRRCAVSIGSNLAEGRGRRADSEFGRFIQIASGSAHELRYQLLVAKDVGYLSTAEYGSIHDSLEEVCRMLWSLQGKVKAAAMAPR